MLNSEKLKSEIDKIPKEYYGIVFDILKSFKIKKRNNSLPFNKRIKDKENWMEFVSQTYGSLSAFPIKREEQGNYETREKIL